ncbi:MAG: leucine-rich repeat protein [Ruminococcus sp.]|nr:leucine-rich repeat protein [Ruminococcus sp.]
MKRILSCLMAIVFLSAILLEFPADLLMLRACAETSDYANDAEHYFTNDKTVSASYCSYRNLYNDDMFDTDANNESTDLAKLSVVLASMAYSESNIKDAYVGMGYSCVTENYDLKPTYDNNDTAAFALGYKQVDNTNYFLCTVRGTPSNCEWFSNFNVGTGTNHEGFNAAAGKIMASLEEFLDIYAETGNGSRNVILITGHSRGAAISNLLGAWLTNTSSYFSSSDIFCYTYACPAVSKVADHSLNNIRNYNNPGDTVAAIPLSVWGYGRYGIDIPLETKGEIFENFKYQFKFHQNVDYTGIDNTTELTTLLQAIAPDIETYNSDRDQFIFGIVAAFFASNGNNADLATYLTRVIYDYGSVDQIVINKVIDYLTNGLSTKISTAIEVITMLVKFEGAYDDTLEYLNGVYADANDAISLWPEYVESCEKNNKEPSFYDFRRSHSSEFSKLASESGRSFETIQEARDALTSLVIIIDKLTELEEGSVTAVDLLFKLMGSTAEKFIVASSDSNLFDGLKNGIMHAHTCETYYYWINSMYYGYEGWSSHDDNGNPTIENTDVTVPGKVTRIGGACFKNCKNIKSLTISDSTIVSCNLDSLSGLKTLTIPIDITGTHGVSDSVMTINFTPGRTGKMLNFVSTKDNGIAYYYRDNTDYYYPTIQSGAKTSLAKITFADGITYIGSKAFYGYTALTNVKLPSTLLAIGDSAFNGCTALKSLTLPSGILEVGYNTFEGCTNLASITLPDSIISLENECFKDCAKLKIAGIPSKIQNIGEYCFSGCTNLATSIVLPDTLNDVGREAFQNVTSITDVTMPCDGEFLSRSMFVCYDETGSYSNYYNNIVNITLTPGKTGIVADNTDTRLDKSSTSSSFSSGRYPNWNKLVLSEGITAIGNGSFCGAGESEVSLPSTLTSIGDYAFQENDSLTTISIPNKVTSIGKYAFNNCDALTTADLGSGVKSVGSYAFFHCAALTDMTFPESVKELGEGTLCFCTSLVSLKLPSALETIPAEMCEGCTLLSEVTMPKALTTIENGAFEDCSSLPEIVIHNKVKTVGQYAFDGCTSLKEIIFPKSVTFIGGGSSFYGDEGTTITVLNPECEIEYNWGSSKYYYFGRTIKGYDGSTAESYAKARDLTFISLGAAPSGDEPVYGDANEDTSVNLNDAVAILQFVALPAKYALTEQGALNADVVDNGTSGVNGFDALAVQMADAKLIDPVKGFPITMDQLQKKLS